jgi:hypothetical protein
VQVPVGGYWGSVAETAHQVLDRGSGGSS